MNYLRNYLRNYSGNCSAKKYSRNFSLYSKVYLWVYLSTHSPRKCSRKCSRVHSRKDSIHHTRNMEVDLQMRKLGRQCECKQKFDDDKELAKAIVDDWQRGICQGRVLMRHPLQQQLQHLLQ